MGFSEKRNETFLKFEVCFFLMRKLYYTTAVIHAMALAMAVSESERMNAITQ